MAKIKIKFRASAVEGKEGTLYYQVIHKRVARQIPCGHRLFPGEWDVARADIGVPRSAGREACLASVRDAVRTYQALPEEDQGFMAFARKIAGQLKLAGRERTAETYATAISSFGRFRQGREVPWEELDSDLMVGYESFLRFSGVCPNTTSFYMRNLRAIYNRAVEKGLTESRNPFRHVYTGIGKTVKRAVPIEVIRRIRDLDLSRQPALGFARDIFMFSFYTRGMSFVDIAFLRKSDLCNGVLTYRRHKTRQQLFVKWEKPMQEIVDRYDTSGSPYLLPVIGSGAGEERKRYRCEAHRVNRYLKRIGERIGLSIPLTTYVARHGWASIAKSKNIPLSTISEAMGHDSEATTRIYLSSLDTSVVDKANRLILGSL